MFVIPSDRLPAGFAERVEDPPLPPAEPRPAATAVLLRDGPDAGATVGPPTSTMQASAGRSHGGTGHSSVEVLLLQRHHASGFVPGAYVFPGGRVDEADASPAAAALLARALPPEASRALEPPAAFWMAALREVFEETGILLASDAAGRPAPDAASEPRLAEWRERLMGAHSELVELLEAEGLLPALDDVVYCAHWITPVAEPRRYDTRFFLARLPAGRAATPDAREMTDALWLSPTEALRRFHDGALPMVFPTVKVLEALEPHATVAEALAAFRGQPVAAVLPRLVRTEGGVGIVVD